MSTSDPKRYTVLSPLIHDQVLYGEGEPIDLNDKQAAPLLALAVIALGYSAPESGAANSAQTGAASSSGEAAPPASGTAGEASQGSDSTAAATAGADGSDSQTTGQGEETADTAGGTAAKSQKRSTKR